MEKGEIILYQPNETIRLEVRLEEESVWLTQAQMAELFQTTPQNITIHIRSIYKEGELEYSSTCKEHLQVRKEGNRTVQRKQKLWIVPLSSNNKYWKKRNAHGIPSLSLLSFLLGCLLIFDISDEKANSIKQWRKIVFNRLENNLSVYVKISMSDVVTHSHYPFPRNFGT